ncbi:MAG: Arc family DNA-binding protein [Thermoleophilia bacterium]|nr:Arc family DNA-binding protein [Thermoleophilia bacterium]
MANFHLRAVPPDLYDALKARAEANGRSVNAELLAIVHEAIDRDSERAELLLRLERLRREFRLPPEALPPEELIREARDDQ